MSAPRIEDLLRVLDDGVGTRRTLVRRLAGLTAAAGLVPFGIGLDETEARKKRKKRRNRRRRDAGGAGQITPPGADTPLPPPPGPQCVEGAIDANGQVCVGGVFVDCGSFTQCAGQACLDGRCRGFETCDNDSDCFSGGSQILECYDHSLIAGNAELCLFDFRDYENSACEVNADCNAGAATQCLLGAWMIPCANNDICVSEYGAAGECNGGVCIKRD